MERLNDLLNITNFTPENVKQETKDFSEEVLMQKAKDKLEKPELPSKELNMPMLFNTLSFPFMKHAINPSNYTFTDTGRLLVPNPNDSFAFLFSYLSRYSKDPDVDVDLSKEYLTPFDFYCFVLDFIDTLAFISSESQSDELNMTNLCRYMIFNTPKLCILKTFGELKALLQGFLLNNCKCSNLSIFTQVFDTAVKKCLSHPKKMPETDMAALLKELLGVSDDEMQKISVHYGKKQDELLCVKYAHERIVSPNNKGEKKEDVVHSNEKIFLITQAIAQKEFQKPRCTGYLHVTIYLRLPKFKEVTEETRIELEFSYAGKTYSKPLKDSLEFIMPVFDNSQIKMSFIRPLKKNNPRAAVNIDTSKTTHVEGNFKIKDMKATFVVNSDYSKLDEPIPVISPLCDYSKSSADQCIDFLVSLMIEKWINKINMLPPLPYYCLLCEFCIQHSLSVSTLFFKILKKLNDCWTSSGSFLEAYVPVLLTCFSISNSDAIKTEEKEMFVAIMEEVKTKIPEIIKQTLAKPDLIEKPSITQLLILLSFSQEYSKVNDYFESMINDSIVQIMDTVTGALLILPSEHESTPQISSLYTCLSRPGVHPELGPNGIIMIDFEVGSLMEASNILLQRASKLINFFTQSSIPKFADHQKSIQSNFKSLGYMLVSAFVSHIPRPPDQVTFKFLPNYRQLWRLLGADPEFSPEKLFMPLLLNWVEEFSPTVIEWTRRAINLDDFTVQMKSSLASSSVLDLFKIFNDTVQFLENLHLEESQMKEVFSSYASLCTNSLSFAVDRFLAFINGLIPKPRALGVVGDIIERVITIEQSYVIINDIFMMREQWKSYYTSFSSRHQIENVVDPFANVMAIINTAIKTYELQIERYVYNKLFKPLWKHQHWYRHGTYRVRKTLMDTMNEVSDSIVEEIRIFIDPMPALIKNFQGKLIVSVFKGTKIGILECLVPYIQNRNIQTYEKIISTLQFTLSTFVEALPENLRQRAYNELEFLKFAESQFQEGFQASVATEVPEDDIHKQFIRALTVKQLAKSRNDKKIAKGIRTRFIDYKFIEEPQFRSGSVNIPPPPPTPPPA